MCFYNPIHSCQLPHTRVFCRTLCEAHTQRNRNPEEKKNIVVMTNGIKKQHLNSDHLRACNSTFISIDLNPFKSTEMALTNIEDMGFCSSEEYELHSPTDSSEDSVEVKICPILLKNKRKLVEPRKVNEKQFNGPLKKRMCLKVKAEEQHPFRPWSPPGESSFIVPVVPVATRPNSSYFRPPTPPAQQDEPVALVKKREETELRVPRHPEIATLSTIETERILLSTTETFPVLQEKIHKDDKSREVAAVRREQRNYKNMTRERRIEANARERTRVHTISAAFDTLRRSIPSYSNVQKLSKLSVLRIACSYIMTLSSIVNESDETADCVDLVTRTIQREGKLRKKKDDND